MCSPDLSPKKKQSRSPNKMVTAQQVYLFISMFLTVLS
jgi:hypothetical protein